MFNRLDKWLEEKYVSRWLENNKYMREDNHAFLLQFHQKENEKKIKELTEKIIELEMLVYKSSTREYDWGIADDYTPQRRAQIFAEAYNVDGLKELLSFNIYAYRRKFIESKEADIKALYFAETYQNLLDKMKNSHQAKKQLWQTQERLQAPLMENSSKVWEWEALENEV
jgi:hypothetical protein